MPCVCTRAGAGRGEQSLLWFRVAAKEEMLFAESQKVLPGLMDMIMCGCGGNAYAVAVTNKRIIIQNDKRCLFGSTTLTTNEESFFLKNVHKANLNTDGALNLGICTLHSAEMLTGGFNWIFFGFIIDIVLEWKPSWIKLLGDARLEVRVSLCTWWCLLIYRESRWRVAFTVLLRVMPRLMLSNDAD